MNRLERLLDLVHVLQTARAPVSLAALREQFPDYARGQAEATRRKFERDKAELAGIGLALRFVDDEGEGEGGYWLDADASYLPPIDLSDTDRALLAGAARAALGSQSVPHRRALRLALAKLDADLKIDPKTDPKTNKGAPHAAVWEAPLVIPAAPGSRGAGWVAGGGPAEPTQPDLSERLEALSDALARRKRVTLLYQKPESAPTRREVDPYALFSKSGIWHLCGHDHLRDATRLFRVSRVLEIEVHAKRPTQPDYSVPETFRAVDYSAMNPLHYQMHAPLTCRVRVDPDVAFLMQTSWGEPGPEGVFDVTTSNLPHLVQQVLSLGLRAELLSPPEARDALRAELDAVLRAHEASPPPTEAAS